MPKLTNEYSCTGCTACKSICPKQCIEMEQNLDGFEFPKIKEPSMCIECGSCEKVCPVLEINEDKEKKSPIAYAAFSNDESMRMDSSSGGIFSELAKVILAKDGVVYGAAYNEVFEVEHICIECVSDLDKVRGAKYAESNLGNTFKDILLKVKQGRYVLFSGTPCQVAGLKSFMKKDYPNLFCVDFVCHGVPSPIAWKAYVEHRLKEDASGDTIRDINMRAKHTGWSRYQYSHLFQYESGKECSITNSQSLFMKLFVGDYISRPSCENCKFKGYSRVSDITLGDFWGIWDIDPEMDDNKGTSVVLVQSDKGKILWNEIENKIRFKEVSLEQASQQNPSMLVSSKANPDRQDVLDKIRNGQISTCESLFGQKKPSIASRIKGRIRGIFHSE